MFTWGLVALLGVALGRGVLLGAPAMGPVPLATLAGFGLCILFIAAGGPRWAGWAVFGLGVWATVQVAMGSAQIVADDEATGTATDAQATEALLAGIELPLVATAAVFGLMMALDVATVA